MTTTTTDSEQGQAGPGLPASDAKMTDSVIIHIDADKLDVDETSTESSEEVPEPLVSPLLSSRSAHFGNFRNTESSFKPKSPSRLNSPSMISEEQRTFKHQLMTDMRYMGRRWRLILLSLMFWWIASILRNISNPLHFSARNEYGPGLGRLNDLMLDFLPTWRGASALSDVMQWSACLALPLVVMLRVYRPSNPHAFNGDTSLGQLGVEALLAIGALQVVRGTIFLSTQLPGAAEHCLPGQKSVFEWSDWPGIIFNFVHENCGDLVFSGHTMTAFLCSLLAWRGSNYSAKVFAFLSLTLSSMIIFILLAENHYTIDVVVAIWITIGYYAGFGDWVADKIRHHRGLTDSTDRLLACSPFQQQMRSRRQLQRKQNPVIAIVPSLNLPSDRLFSHARSLQSIELASKENQLSVADSKRPRRHSFAGVLT
ncbi:MAG: hypothetical protein MHM6MM_001473 [Cercozoa sp. M6MM]